MGQIIDVLNLNTTELIGDFSLTIFFESVLIYNFVSLDMFFFSSKVFFLRLNADQSL